MPRRTRKKEDNPKETKESKKVKRVRKTRAKKAKESRAFGFKEWMANLQSKWYTYGILGAVALMIGYWYILGYQKANFVLMAGLLYVFGFLIADFDENGRELWYPVMLLIVGYVTYYLALSFYYYPAPGRTADIFGLFMKDYVYLLAGLVLGNGARVVFEKSEGKKIRII